MARPELKIHKSERKGKYSEAGVGGDNFLTETGFLQHRECQDVLAPREASKMNKTLKLFCV